MAITHIVSHPNLRDVVEELDSNPEERVPKANEDTRSFLKTKGFEFPEQWSVKFIHESPLTIQVCINSHCGQISVNLS